MHRKLSPVEEAVWNLASPLCQELGLELVDVSLARQWGRTVLRVLIDKPDGVTVDDCVRLSEALNDPLDELDPVSGSYGLEVSSPGIERPLLRQADFERFSGRRAEVRTVGPVDGRRRWEGRLAGLEGDDVLLDVEGSGTVRIPVDLIRRAKLVYEEARR